MLNYVLTVILRTLSIIGLGDVILRPTQSWKWPNKTF